jgi:hypothetical protein
MERHCAPWASLQFFKDIRVNAFRSWAAVMDNFSADPVILV